MKNLFIISLLFLIPGMATNGFSQTHQVQKPQLTFTDLSPVSFCDSTHWQVAIDIANTSALTAYGDTVSYYCYSGGSLSCLVGQTAIDSIAGNSNYIDTVNITNTCTGCDSIVAVINGCACEQDTSEILAVSSYYSTPTANFQISDSCFVAGDSLHFISASTINTVYLWDFGDGTSSTDVNPVHIFDDYGYHCVSLTVTNTCGTAESNQTLYVNPTGCACDSNIVFDFPDNTVINTNNNNWNPATFPSGEILIAGDVFIPSGITMNIHDVTLKFAPRGKIIVDRGATLNLLQTTLTHLDGCNTMWQGIEVWGDPTNYLQVGRLLIKNDVTIENAHIGILIGKRNLHAICDTSLPAFDLAYSGGFAGVISSNFINNGTAYKGTRRPTNNGSKGNGYVEKCNFVSTTLPDAAYNSNNAYHYPSPTNPFVYASPHGRTSSGITINDFEMENNYFNNFTNLDTCIKSINSHIYAENCTFEEANFGFYAIHTFTSFNSPHIIKGCTFNKIHNDADDGKAIYILGGEYDKIYNNLIRNTSHILDSADIAIQLDFTTNYEVTENQIQYIKHGIIANWNVAGLIGANGPNWKGNRFDNCYSGIETNWANSNLIIKCNDHTPDIINPNNYNVNWDNTGIIIYLPWPFNLYLNLSLGDQGVNGTNPDDPAGNEFLQINEKQITSTTSYIYYHHLLDTSLFNVYRPTLETGSAAIDRVATGADYISDSCACSDPAVTPPLAALSFSVPPYSELDALNTLKNNLFNILDGLTIDGGKTQTLLNAITGNVSSGRLKNMLIANSPLSDTVIYTLMTENALSPGNFKNVMRINLPVSNLIVEDFYNYIKNFPAGIKKQLMQLQIDNPGVVTLAGIQREIGQVQTAYFRKLTKIINALLDTTDYRKNDAIALLEYDGSVISKQVLYSTYLEDGNYGSAADKLNEIEAFNLFYMNDYVELNRRILTLYQNQKTIYDMDGIDLAYVRDLAHRCPPNPAIYEARAIIEAITGEHVPSCPKNFGTRSMQIQKLNTNSMNRKPMLGDNYPDPFNDYTIIPYDLSKNNKGEIIIKDVLGKTITAINISSKNKELKLKTGHWAKGIYYYSLKINNDIIDTKKMVITK